MGKDYRLGLLAGLLTGICLIPTALNVGKDNPSISGYISEPFLIALPFICAVGIAFGIWLGKFLSNFIPVMFQIARFAAVGILNTAINFAVINIFSLVRGVTAGLEVGEYNIPATAIAATNSYFWNKYWVFKGSNQGAARQIPEFIAVTTLGLIARSGLLILITSYVSHSGIADGAWLNIANVIATFAGILVDFLGYKFIVFKKTS